MKEKIFTGITIFGMVLIAVAIVMPAITRDIHNDTFRYLFAAGSVLMLVGRLFTPYHGKNVRLGRLYRIETWSAAFFCAAAFFMFKDRANLRDPIALTLAGALIQMYASVMIAVVTRKAEKEKLNK